MVPLEAILKGVIDFQKWALMEGLKDMRQAGRQNFEGDYTFPPHFLLTECDVLTEPTCFPILNLNLQSQNKSLFAS